jgi:hypothetical protein
LTDTLRLDRVGSIPLRSVLGRGGGRCPPARRERRG